MVMKSKKKSVKKEQPEEIQDEEDEEEASNLEEAEEKLKKAEEELAEARAGLKEKEDEVPNIESLKEKDLIVVNELITQPVRIYTDDTTGKETEFITRDEALKEILEILRKGKEN